MKTPWQITQERQLEDHKKGASVFSDEKQIGAVMTGSFLQQLIPSGSCLDVGCGILPLPGYMQSAPSVKFTGIDPMQGEKRKFHFVQGMAEQLPFADNTFDAVLFATSLDHIENPKDAISEAGRVLKPQGYIVVWGSFRMENDAKYIQWQKTRSVTLYNHPWVFSIKSIDKLFADFKRLSATDIQNSEKILIYQNG